MPRPDVSDERIPQILNAALKVFNRKGLAAARMEDIAREAKLSIGGVYWYYKGKDEVVLAIVDKVIDEDVAVLTSLLNEQGTVRERLLGYVREDRYITEGAVPAGVKVGRRSHFSLGILGVRGSSSAAARSSFPSRKACSLVIFSTNRSITRSIS